ncbi:hypothetical protein GCM10009768_04400 [Leucobacter iarius]|uniref:Uncharacterized protein n=1 Tax=Leucobacter iarius TaxID=333963 RepID=A0ABN2L8A8_9MICO
MLWSAFGRVRMASIPEMPYCLIKASGKAARAIEQRKEAHAWTHESPVPR